MPAVDDKARIAPPHVEPAGPADTGQTLADVVVGQLPAALLPDGGGRQGDGRVVQLVVAEQRQLDVYKRQHYTTEHGKKPVFSMVSARFICSDNSQSRHWAVGFRLLNF